LSPEAILREGKAIRGGIPVCGPWFGPHPIDAAKPSHGVLRNRRWRHLATTETTEAVSMLLALEDDAATRELFPYSFRAMLRVTAGASLAVELAWENRSDELIVFTGALHSYLAVGDVREITVRGLDGLPYLDEVGTPTPRVQRGDIRFEGEVDRDFLCAGPVLVHDPVLGRTLRITAEGSGSTVVWNPWIEKAKRLPDLPAGDYRKFVCIESANVWTDRVRIPPGGTHRLATLIEVLA
jgi:glucose-6-phosphate 1-epimerase